MFSLKRLSLLAVVLASVACLAPATASATPTMSLSFTWSAGNSAGWVTHNQEAYLTVASDAPGSYAAIAVKHFPSALPATEPSFSTDNYASGTPRIDMFLSDGSVLFIYPDGSVEDNVTGPYASYDAFAQANPTDTVTGVYVLADTSRPVPYTSNITSFQYNGDYLIGHP